MSREQLTEMLMQRAIIKLQNTFILQEIARREGIEVSPEEVQEVLRIAAQQMATLPAERARLMNDPELANRIRNELLLERTLQKLVEIVKIERERLQRMSRIIRSQLIPMVVEQTARGERAYDIYSRSAQRPDHLLGGTHRRSGRQPGDCRTALP
jgi:Cdc6-like AAA superfamily ATPase